MRTKTRKERYASKTGQVIPASITTVEFANSRNLGFVVRSAACFGIKRVNVIGKVPEYRELNQLSATTLHLVDIFRYQSEEEFLECHYDDYLVAAEITEDSCNFLNYEFSFDKPVNIIVGHETIGVPGTLIHYVDDVVEIPLPGQGYCLNTSQTANIIIYEFVKQWMKTR